MIVQVCKILAEPFLNSSIVPNWHCQLSTNVQRFFEWFGSLMVMIAGKSDAFFPAVCCRSFVTYRFQCRYAIGLGCMRKRGHAVHVFGMLSPSQEGICQPPAQYKHYETRSKGHAWIQVYYD